MEVEVQASGFDGHFQKFTLSGWCKQAELLYKTLPLNVSYLFSQSLLILNEYEVVLHSEIPTTTF